MGQMIVLLSEALDAPLLEVGVEEVASNEMLDLMEGEGPQHITESYLVPGEKWRFPVRAFFAANYLATFHVYPWQAADATSGMPRDGVFTWVAPGGSGDHSLPGDFLPGDITPFGDGRRVVVIVGPKVETTLRFGRVIGGTRAFSGLRARIDGVRRLSAEETRSLRGSLADALSSATAS
jgi:hypothetical protein